MFRSVVYCPLILAFLAATSVFAGSISGNPKQFRRSPDGNSVVFEGKWIRTSKRRTIEVPDANAFRIECSRRENTCREYVAKLITPSDDPQHDVTTPVLFLMLQEFRVQSWSDATIRAIAQPGAADITLEIRFAESHGVRTSVETDSRGASGARSIPDRWVSE